MESLRDAAKRFYFHGFRLEICGLEFSKSENGGRGLITLKLCQLIVKRCNPLVGAGPPGPLESTASPFPH